jgi:RNA-directed DNA polymerase
MSRRHDGLFGQISSFAALDAAARRAVAGKRRKPGAAAFLANLEPELLRLQDELRCGSYRTGAYTPFVVRDPKRRMVSAAPFRDRVVHHALIGVIGPIFERGFIDHSYANRLGKGTHRAINRFERWRDQYPFVLRADIWRYFPAMDHAILKQDLRRRLACEQTLALCDTIIDGSNPQEPAQAYFPGDDLFSVAARRRGLPLGNLTSQFFANVYLDALDHWICEVLRLPYLRYVDDMAAKAASEQQLHEARARIDVFLARRRLLLHPGKTAVLPCREPQTFLGFELLPGGRRRLVPANVSRLRSRLQAMRRAWAHGELDKAQVQQRIGAWVAHARHADTVRLRHTLFKGGWFDPHWANGSPVKAASP